MNKSKENGVRIPEDVSIVGMDDLNICKIADPALTTIRVPRKAMGRIAVKRMIEKLSGKEKETQKIKVDISLIERQSVKKLI